MPNENLGAGNDIVQWAVMGITALGVILQYFWSREQLSIHRKQDQYDKHIADPAKKIVLQIDDFVLALIAVEHGKKPDIVQQRGYATLIRAINTFIQDCFNSPVAGGNCWYEISTRDIELGIYSDPDLEFNILNINSLETDLERLKAQIQDNVSVRRPK